MINLIPAKTVVTTLHSREVASIKLEEDFATAHTVGDKFLAIFLKKQIFSRDKELDVAIHRNSRVSFINHSASEKNSNPM